MATAEQLALVGGPATVPEGSHHSWPELGEADREAVLRILDRGLLAGANAPEITALQEEYGAYLGAAHCLAVNTGTAALHCCAAAIGLEPGYEAIIPAYTFVATALAMVHQGAVPVFCDVDVSSYNIDPALIEERITDRTKAIVAVHIHGRSADMDEIMAVAGRHGLAVIEDVAQAHGGVYRGRRLGTIGDCAGMSLNQSKNLSAGEGGLFVTDDDDAYKAARRLSVFGEDLVPLEAPRLLVSRRGLELPQPGLSSALARVQLRRLDRYKLELASDRITVNAVAPGHAAIPMNFGEEEVEAMSVAREAIPLRQLAAPEEIAVAIAYLTSPDASYTTGASLLVDGGLLLVSGPTVLEQNIELPAGR